MTLTKIENPKLEAGNGWLIQNKHGIIRVMIEKTLSEPQKRAETPRISLALLGVPRLKSGEQAIRLPYLKAELLLYYLTVAGGAHNRAALAALFWNQSAESQARNSLRNALYTIRRTLKPAAPLIVERDAVRPDVKAIHLDVSHFQIAIEQATETTALADALTLWRGPFLEGVHLPDNPVFEEWLTRQRLHYDFLYRRGLFRLGQLYSARKQWPEAQQTLEKLLLIDPLHEAGHQQLMRLYRQMGDRTAALRQYETLRQCLVEALGVDPAPATQALHLELLREGETTAPAPPPTTFLPKPIGRYQFVGRDREMVELSEFYQTILPHGPACLVMIEGEPGIGKTRLAKEWLATLDSVTILTTRCFEAEQAIPFQPWIDLIRTTMERISLPRLRVADVWLTELAHLAPEIRRRRPDLELSALTDPDLARGRIVQAIYHWLEALCQQGPLCIFIDDWQWLDQASLTVLRYMLRPAQSRRLPLLILGAQRETRRMADWPQFKASLEREKMLRQVALQRLSLSDVAALAQSIALPNPDIFLERLLTETEGNPLFITEFLQTLDPEELKPDHDWPIPPTIQTVIRSRLARLSDATRQTLAAAAVIGRHFTETMLHQVSRLALETILQALDEAIAANLVAEQPRTYDFTHDKIRAVLLDDLTGSRRRYLHLQIAAALEATLSNDFGLLSYHFERGGDFLQVRDYGLRAARQSIELYADEEALHWYDKVEAMLKEVESETSPEIIPQITPFQQTHVSRALPFDIPGLIYRQRGLIRQRIGRYSEADRAFRAALERAQARKRLDEQAAAHNLLSFLAYLRSDYDGVGHHAQKALALAAQTDEAALRAPGLRHLGIAVYRTGDYDRARALYDEALSAYLQANDRLGMAGVYNNIGFVLRTQARYVEAIAAFQEALTIYEATGQVEGIALICSNIGRTYAFSGDLAQARQYLERGLALSREAHTDWITVKIHRTTGNVLAQSGQWSQALTHAQQACNLARNLGSDEDLGAALRLLAEIAQVWPDDRLENPVAYFEQSIALLQRVGAQDELERTKAALADYMKRLTA